MKRIGCPMIDATGNVVEETSSILFKLFTRGSEIMNKFRFLISIFLLSIALVLLFTEKSHIGIPTTIITSVCTYWFSRERGG